MLKSVLILSALHGLFVGLALWGPLPNPRRGPQGRFLQRLLDGSRSLTLQEHLSVPGILVVTEIPDQPRAQPGHQPVGREI